MIDYDENYIIGILFNRQGSVAPKAVIYSLPSAVIAIVVLVLKEQVENFFEETGLDGIRQSFMWNAMTAVISILLGFRTRQALGRFWEGTSLLHQMRGEWFDTMSCLITFSRDAKITKGKAAEVMEFRHTLIRLMSLMHASALDEISATPDNDYAVLDISGLDTTSLKFLRDCRELGFNRVEALQHMIQVLVTANHHTGVLTIPPPILSRIYQTLSRGLVNLLNARKIKDTMFPFPYAQIIMWLLFVHSIFTPLIMTQSCESKVVAALLSFAPIFGMFCLNFTATELEMPFGVDENDLPLRYFQKEMNESLLMLVHDMADHVPHTSVRAIKEFDCLEAFVNTGRSPSGSVLMSAKPSHVSAYYAEPDFFDDNEDDISNNSEAAKELSAASPPETPVDHKAVARNSNNSTPIPRPAKVSAKEANRQNLAMLNSSHKDERPVVASEKGDGALNAASPHLTAKASTGPVSAATESGYPQPDEPVDYRIKPSNMWPAAFWTTHDLNPIPIPVHSTPRTELDVRADLESNALRPRTQAQCDVENMFEAWVQLIDCQIQELRRNTESVDALTKHYEALSIMKSPIVSTQHHEAFVEQLLNKLHCRMNDGVDTGGIPNTGSGANDIPSK